MKPNHLLGGTTPRALMSSVRADVSDPKALISQISAAFEAFKAKNDETIGDIKAKIDPLDIEQIGKMSASILDLQTAIDKQAVQMAAHAANGGDNVTLADPEYSALFASNFRSGDDEAKVKAAQKTGIRAALTEGTSTAGGYTTPVEWDRTITNKLKLLSPMRDEAAVITTSNIGFSKVFNDRAVGSGWVGETAARPETTTPGFTSLTWANGEIYANAAASQDFLDDSLIDIAAWLTGEIDYEFARQEGIAFISGNGTNKPNGLLTYVTGGTNAATHPFGAITTVASGAVGAYTTDAIVGIMGALPKMWEGNAKFYTNRASLTALMKLKDGQGNYIWQPSYVLGQPQSLRGMPIVDMPDFPAIATGAFSLLYGDMRATYLIVDRMGTRVLRDPYTNKPFVMFYCTKRVGGGVQNPEAMKAIVIG